MKVTRPGSDLSRESLAFRVEQLEQRRRRRLPRRPQRRPAQSGDPSRPSPPRRQRRPSPPRRHRSLSTSSRTPGSAASSLPCSQRSIPVASFLGEARPSALAGETLTLEFPATADFHRRQAEEPKNVGVIRDALYEVTGHRLAVLLELGEAADADADEEDDEVTEDAFISMFKDTFDAQEVEETR